jgi:hypothetical protein
VAGKFGVAADDQAFVEAHCTDCPKGKWQDTAAQVSCFNCTAGRFATDDKRTTKCEDCPSGKYQTLEADTSCIHCAAGYHHASNETAAIEIGHCTHCPNGQFQGDTAQVKCELCNSSSYTDGSFTHTQCKECPVRDALRYFWTEGNQGWDHCVKKPLPCKLESDGPWSPCTESCKKTTAPETFGDEDEFFSPVYHAWGGGTACSATKSAYHHGDQDFLEWDATAGPVDSIATYTDSAAGVGTPESTEPARNMGKWQNKAPCNEHYCPVDCVVTEWSAWGVCTKACLENATQPGRTSKSRTITTPVAYGGKICPTLTGEKDCNLHPCKIICNDHHATCAVKQWSWHNNAVDGFWKHNITHRHQIPVHPFTGASITRHVYPNNVKPCPHNSADCMRTKDIEETIEVVHDKKFQHFASNFQCALTSGITGESPRVCECKCAAHPTGCYSTAEKYVDGPCVESNDGVLGVADFRKCSDLCTMHPDCTHWNYGGFPSKCFLYQGAVSAKVATEGFWAGLPNHQAEADNVAICDRDRNLPAEAHTAVVQCPAGKYVTTAGAVRVCDTCPLGKYTPFPNQPVCYEGHSGWNCTSPKNFITGLTYSQIDVPEGPLHLLALNETIRHETIKRKPFQRQTPVQYCKAACLDRPVCKGFFYQKRSNGAEICGFYTDNVEMNWANLVVQENATGSVCAYTPVINAALLPTPEPTSYPTHAPTRAMAGETYYPTPYPTAFPTAAPTSAPTAYPTAYPTAAPTAAPTPAPTAYPSLAPTDYPTAFPTVSPTEYPTAHPTRSPTKLPTAFPTKAPTAPTPAPAPILQCKGRDDIIALIRPVNPSECAALNQTYVDTLPSCVDAECFSLCEADSECSTNEGLDNCMPHISSANDSSDVYYRHC